MPIDPRDVHDLLRALTRAIRPENEWNDLVKALIWPAVVALAIYLLRNALRQFLVGFGRRVTGFKIFEIGIELAPATVPPVSFTELIEFRADDLKAGQFTSTDISTLLQAIHQDEFRQYYLLVDIGNGRRWLRSRLFILTFVLWRIGAIECVVFVDRLEGAKNLLGVATARSLCTTLGTKYRWFDEALAMAFIDVDKLNPIPTPYSLPPNPTNKLPALKDPMPRHDAAALAMRFSTSSLIRQPGQLADESEWEEVGPAGGRFWEHTKWLTKDDLQGDLRIAILPSDEAQLLDTPDTPLGKRNRALLRRKAPFIALVNERGELKQLVDRTALMHSLADALRREDEIA